MSGEYMYRGELVELDQTASTEAAFWTLARGKIFDSVPDWSARIEQQMASGQE